VRDRSRAAARDRAFQRCLASAGASVLALLLAGCVTESNRDVHGTTIAFESIDGPPRPVFDRLVARLDAQARAQRLAVVSRQALARYRVRAYLAATVERRQTAIAWVCDVYDAELRRATRIAGEEQALGSGQHGWAAVDDRVLESIAAAAMTRLSVFAAGTAPAEVLPAAPNATPPGPADSPLPASEIRIAGTMPSTGGASAR
jgi:hypothetical protein